MAFYFETLILQITIGDPKNIFVQLCCSRELAVQQVADNLESAASTSPVWAFSSVMEQSWCECAGMPAKKILRKIDLMY